MSNMAFSKNIEAISNGVEKVEIKDWIKTREVDEVEGDEKKLNSEVFNDIENTGVGDEELALLTGLLYQESSKELRTVKAYNSKLENSDLTVQGNKILRTLISSDIEYHPFKISTISTWLINNNSNYVKWKDGEYNTNIITWPCYSKYTNKNSVSKGAAEYRMLEGKFVLSEEQISLIRNKKVQAVLGVSTNDEKGFETIIPFKDLIGIYINNNLTQLHYKSSPTGYYTFNHIPEGGTKSTLYEYNYLKSQDGNIYCNEGKHNLLSSHIEGRHVDLNILNNKMSGNFYQMEGDIGSRLYQGENNIKILIGQQINTMGDMAESFGGTSKLDLFLIENPQLKVELSPYFIRNNEKIYLDSDYIFTCGEVINYDVKIENTGNTFSLDKLKLDVNFVVGEYNSQNKIIETLKINEENIIYKNQNITKDVDIFIKGNENEQPILTSLSSLNSIKTGESIILSSGNIKYLVSEYNGINKNIEYNYVSRFNYLDDYFFYKYEDKGNYKVNELKASIDIIIECEDNCDDYFYVKIEEDSQSTNLRLKSNENYKVSNLDINKNYKISMIDDITHKSVASEYISFTNQNRNRRINLRTSPKHNNYFTQRKIQKINR